MIFNPLAWDYQTWRWFFAVAALWNLVGAVDGLTRPAFNLKKYYGVERDDFHLLFLNRAFWWAVLVFGIGYALIAHSPADHTGIIIMGIIGKVLVSGNWICLYATSRARAPALFGAVGDSLFTVFFILYLVGGARS
jgi:hypothetical protein